MNSSSQSSASAAGTCATLAAGPLVMGARADRATNMALRASAMGHGGTTRARGRRWM
jgi:hypothetical protein